MILTESAWESLRWGNRTAYGERLKKMEETLRKLEKWQ